jgi:hypothetical protein
MEILDGCRNRYMGTMIATHAVYRYGDIQFWNALGSGINSLSRTGETISLLLL